MTLWICSVKVFSSWLIPEISCGIVTFPAKSCQRKNAPTTTTTNGMTTRRALRAPEGSFCPIPISSGMRLSSSLVVSIGAGGRPTDSAAVAPGRNGLPAAEYGLGSGGFSPVAAGLKGFPSAEYGLGAPGSAGGVDAAGATAPARGDRHCQQNSAETGLAAPHFGHGRFSATSGSWGVGASEDMRVPGGYPGDARPASSP